MANLLTVTTRIVAEPGDYLVVDGSEVIAVVNTKKSDAQKIEPLDFGNSTPQAADFHRSGHEHDKLLGASSFGGHVYPTEDLVLHVLRVAGSPMNAYRIAEKLQIPSWAAEYRAVLSRVIRNLLKDGKIKKTENSSRLGLYRLVSDLERNP